MGLGSKITVCRLLLSAWALLTLAMVGCGDSSEGGAGPSGPRAYVTVSGTAEVLVIDDATRDIVSRMGVGAGPAIILATPDTKKLYTANWADNSVSAIDVATEQVTRIPTGGRPYVIAMAPDGAHVYAGLASNEIAVIDTETDVITKTFPRETLPASLIVSPDGETLYVATLGAFVGPGSLYALSTADGSEVHPAIQVGATPAWITIGKDGSRVYTLNFLSDDVSVVDTKAWQVVKTVATGEVSQGFIGHVTPDGSRLYVTNYGTADMVAIDTDSHEVVQTIKLKGRPVGVNFSADGKLVYVTDFGPDSLLQSSLSGADFLLTGNFSATGNGNVSSYDVKTGELVGTEVVTGAGPTSVVVSAP